MLKLNLCDYGDANIVVKGAITVQGTYENNRTDKKF